MIPIYSKISGKTGRILEQVGIMVDYQPLNIGQMLIAVKDYLGLSVLGVYRIPSIMVIVI